MAQPLRVSLYLDEDVSVFVAQLLRPQQRTVLTHNRPDYERLHEAALREHRSHAGILIASRRASDFDLARRIMTVLNTFTVEEVVNHSSTSKN